MNVRWHGFFSGTKKIKRVNTHNYSYQVKEVLRLRRFVAPVTDLEILYTHCIVRSFRHYITANQTNFGFIR